MGNNDARKALASFENLKNELQNSQLNLRTFLYGKLQRCVDSIINSEYFWNPYSVIDDEIEKLIVEMATITNFVMVYHGIDRNKITEKAYSIMNTVQKIEYIWKQIIQLDAKSSIKKDLPFPINIYAMAYGYSMADIIGHFSFNELGIYHIYAIMENINGDTIVRHKQEFKVARDKDLLADMFIHKKSTSYIMDKYNLSKAGVCDIRNKTLRHVRVMCKLHNLAFNKFTFYGKRYPDECGLDTPTENLKLSRKAMNCLIRGGLNTVGDIINKMNTEEGLTQLYRCGPELTNEIKEKVLPFMRLC